MYILKLNIDNFSDSKYLIKCILSDIFYFSINAQCILYENIIFSYACISS